MIEKEVVLEVKNLKKYFPASHKRVLKAVDDVSFTIHKGETFGIVGESGCGKTTCGKTCTGILTKTDGQVLYQGKDVLIVEDIIDSGRTLAYLIEILKQRGPKSIHLCTLLDKPERRVKKQVHVDYTCFTIPDEFVVGYGLDYDQKYRNLPYIGVVESAQE